MGSCPDTDIDPKFEPRYYNSVFSFSSTLTCRLD